MFLRKLILVVVSIVLLTMISGCARYHPQPLSTQSGIEAIQNRTLDREALKKAFPSLYNSETSDQTSWDLSELTLEAYLYNSDLAIAQAQWERQKGELLSEREIPNPDLTFSPGYNTTSDRDVIPSWIIGSAFDFPVFFTGKRAARIDRARFLSDAARLHLISIVWDIRSNVRNTYLHLYEAMSEHTLLLEEQTFIEEKQILYSHLVNIGEITPQEYKNVLARYNEITLLVTESADRLREAQLECANTIGVPVKALNNVQFAFDEFEEPLPEIPLSEARNKALLNNTRLLGALAEYNAAQKDLQLAVRQQYPDLRIGPGYEYDQGENKWSLGLSLELPIFTRHTGHIAAAEGTRAEKAAVFDGIQTRIINASESAISGYDVLRKNVFAADELLKNTSAIVEKQEKLHNIGEFSSLDLIDGHLQLITAEKNKLSTYVRAYEILGNIEDTIQLPCIGGGWDLESLQSGITGDTQ